MTRQFWIVVGSLAAGLVLVIWLGWQFALRPVAREIASQTDVLTAKEADLAKVKGAQLQYDKFKRDADATRHEVQLLRQRLDPDLTEGELVRIINGQAQALNPRDLTWEYGKRGPSKVEGQSGLDEVSFKMTFKSDYETVGRLLNGMVSQLRLISPEKLSLTAFNDLNEGRLTVSVVVEFKLFLETPSKGGA